MVAATKGLPENVLSVKTQNALFVFHRDLRVIDNIGLFSALETFKKVYTVFIFTPEQVSSQNKYKSNNCVQFMIEALEDLASQIRRFGGELIILYGNTINMVKYLIDELSIQAVFFNKDYSPYAIRRDNEVFDMCMKKGVYCVEYHDYLLYEVGSVKNSSGEYYKKFTPFYEAVIRRKVDAPIVFPRIKNKLTRLAKTTKRLLHRFTLHTAMKQFVGERNPQLLVHGGRKLGVDRLKTAITEQRHYDEQRDYFVYETTFLSAYIKFGCISIREVYHAFLKKFGSHSGIIRELIWREFFAHVLYGFPEVMEGSFQPIYKNINWRTSTVKLYKWMNAKTGFPLVDACMRQMNQTGYMHNRGRMLVASFLCKTLLLDWRLGEQYFAQTLVDYDPASNNGNWQGISGTGVDMKPYFRDMNPWIQSQKFDGNAVYIKKWIPELKDVSAEHIHNWSAHCKDTEYKKVKYPSPIVDYYEQKEKMLEMYNDI
jgi:deoxyribodipyrimidine photo-lyase